MLPSTQALGPATPDGAAPVDAPAAADDAALELDGAVAAVELHAAMKTVAATARAPRRLTDEVIKVLPPAGPASAEPSGHCCRSPLRTIRCRGQRPVCRR